MGTAIGSGNASSGGASFGELKAGERGLRAWVGVLQSRAVVPENSSTVQKENPHGSQAGSAQSRPADTPLILGCLGYFRLA